VPVASKSIFPLVSKQAKESLHQGRQHSTKGIPGGNDYPHFPFLLLVRSGWILCDANQLDIVYVGVQCILDFT
jgi:hypothetical protein